MENIFLCRPDNTHWCVECCRGRTCCLLGDIGEDKMGCLGYNGKLTKDGLAQTAFCQNFNCLSSKQLEHKKELIQIITKLPSGEFKISEVLKTASMMQFYFSR